MKVLLDSNIILHKETHATVDQIIDVLYDFLNKAKCTKCIHPTTLARLYRNLPKETSERFNTKTNNYEKLSPTVPIPEQVKMVSAKIDIDENDKTDTLLLNELFCEKVDILISDNKKIQIKAALLGIEDRVFSIDSFLEMIASEHSELVDYKVLAVKQSYFRDIDLNDPFFDSLKEDYSGFEEWFTKKADRKAYVTYNKNQLLSFLFLKIEDSDECYDDISPIFKPKKRLKVGTFKVVGNGVRLGERFMKIIFDNAVVNEVEEIYVTIFNGREEQKRLISLLEDWGFYEYGAKGGHGELVYVRNFSKCFDIENPKKTFPFIPTNTNVFLVPIYPDYHTELLPDSFLRTESPLDYVENEPYRNALSKVYISRSIHRNIKRGDVIIFYRTASLGKSAYYTSVITTIGIIEEKIDNIKSEANFIEKARKRSIFTEERLKDFWNYNSYNRPFLIKFLSAYSFQLGNRINRQKLLDLGILTGERAEMRGLKQITNEQFQIILREAKVDERVIVH